MNSAGSITVVTGGTERTVTVSPTDTVNDVLTALAGLGITGSVQDGRIALTGTEGAYISGMSENVLNALKIEAGENKTWHTVASNAWVNSNSRDLNNVRVVNIDGNSKISSITDYDNGNGEIAIHKNDGTWTTITIDPTKTLNDFFSQLSAFGLNGSVSGDGLVTIMGTGNVYLQAVEGGSNILTSLNMSNVVTNVQTVTVNRTSASLYHTRTVAATGTTTLENLEQLGGTGITFDGNNASIFLTTTDDNGTSTVTLDFTKTSTLHSVIDRLANYGIIAQIDTSGRFSLSSST